MFCGYASAEGAGESSFSGDEPICPSCRKKGVAWTHGPTRSIGARTNGVKDIKRGKGVEVGRVSKKLRLKCFAFLKGLTAAPAWGRTGGDAMYRRLIYALLLPLLFCRCSQLQSDCAAVAEREAQIAAEPKGDYYVGRRYHIPYTRFWGYLRKSGESWRTAKLVMMDESIVHTPDRGPEPPLKNAVYGTDQNAEYIIRGSYTGRVAYDSATDKPYPLFRATSYELRSRKPGFLFKPSEKYSEEFVTLMPEIMPKPEVCAEALKKQ